MKLKNPFDHTWKGLIFGVVLLSLCFSFVVVPPFVLFCKVYLPEMSSEDMAGIAGGIGAGLIVISLKVAKGYWDWADRVMARLFGGSAGSDDEA